jgi:hypothetical protein
MTVPNSLLALMKTSLYWSIVKAKTSCLRCTPSQMSCMRCSVWSQLGKASELMAYLSAQMGLAERPIKANRIIALHQAYS